MAPRRVFVIGVGMTKFEKPGSKVILNICAFSLPIFVYHVLSFCFHWNTHTLVYLFLILNTVLHQMEL